MNMRIKTILPFFLLVFLLIGCTQDTSTYMQDPISLSGDTTYYAAMDPALRKTALENKHIALTGTVSASGHTTFFIGDEQYDEICFSCTFSEQNDTISDIRVGATVQLHGVCTGIVGDLVYLEYCQLTSFTSPAANNTTVPPTAAHTTPPTTNPTIPPTTEPATPPTTEPPHTHSFSAATCTTPKTCSCGATEGSANGHNYVSGTCSVCGASDSNYNKITYILNISTKKFHHTHCSRLPTKNRQDTTLSREEIITQGYKPCGYCDP